MSNNAGGVAHLDIEAGGRRYLRGADWIVRHHTPAWLEHAGIHDRAAALRTLPELTPATDLEDVRAELDVVTRDIDGRWESVCSAVDPEHDPLARAAAWTAARRATRRYAASCWAVWESLSADGVDDDSAYNCRALCMICEVALGSTMGLLLMSGNALRAAAARLANLDEVHRITAFEAAVDCSAKALQSEFDGRRPRMERLSPVAG